MKKKGILDRSLKIKLLTNFDTNNGATTTLTKSRKCSIQLHKHPKIHCCCKASARARISRFELSGSNQRKKSTAADCAKSSFACVMMAFPRS